MTKDYQDLVSDISGAIWKIRDLVEELDRGYNGDNIPFTQAQIDAKRAIIKQMFATIYQAKEQIFHPVAETRMEPVIDEQTGQPVIDPQTQQPQMQQVTIPLTSKQLLLQAIGQELDAAAAAASP